jgi:hypothetical protein
VSCSGIQSWLKVEGEAAGFGCCEGCERRFLGVGRVRKVVGTKVNWWATHNASFIKYK